VFFKENKQELEQLKSQLKELTTENTHLKKKLHRASHESKLRKEKEKGKCYFSSFHFFSIS